MSLGNITITLAGVDYVYNVSSVASNGTEVTRNDVVHGSLALPFDLIQGIQRPSGKKPGRFLMKAAITKRNAETGDVATVSAHTVLTVPQSVAISSTDVEQVYGLLRTFLTSQKAVEMAQGVLF